MIWLFGTCLCLSEGEEVLKSRVLLLQLMQNCFPMLPNPLEPRGSDEGATAAACPSTSSSAEPPSASVKAVLELYTHLCHSKTLSAVIQLRAVKKIRDSLS